MAEKLAINVLLAGFNPKAYIDQTASELLFEGYRDSLIDLVRFGSDKLKLKIQMPFDRFGYMYPVCRKCPRNIRNLYNNLNINLSSSRNIEKWKR